MFRARAALFSLPLLIACSVERTPVPTLGKERPAAPPVLTLGTYFPGASEREVVGPITARIQRRSPAFSRLARCTHPEIVFKDEEETDADRMMTPRMKERLERLAVLVSREWPGVRLRVTEAWDENAEHGDNSIHYEGRAVDLTASDQDLGKLGRLAGLALVAGFDWVAHEPTHVHASVSR